MRFASFARGLIWSVVALVVVFHIAGGWYFSGVLIEDGFVPEPHPVVLPSGDFEIEEVAYATPLGEMGAWFLPASGNTWVVHVHGNGTTPAEAEHLFGVLQQAGYPQLAITYRNDDAQPTDPSGHHQYGATEWADVAGAVEHARANGGGNVVLAGYSTGGSHVLSYAYRHNIDLLKGIILDAPNIDMGDSVNFAFSRRPVPLLPMNVPPTLAATAKFITSLRIGVNWKTIDYVSKAGTSLRLPVLVIHGTEDGTVPVAQSVRFVEMSPDQTRLLVFEGAGHVDSYQSDPDRYLAEVLRFMQEVG